MGEQIERTMKISGLAFNWTRKEHAERRLTTIVSLSSNVFASEIEAMTGQKQTVTRKETITYFGEASSRK
jgi:hypothetical protein